MTQSDRPETTMVKRALVPGAVAFAVAVALGWLLDGPGAAASAGIGILLVLANFSASGLSLGWASTVSIGAVMAVALGGFLLRLGLILAAMLALDTLSWFSPPAFGLAVVPATFLLLAYEAQLVSKGLGGTLQIPADPAAARAGAAYTAREAR